MLNIQGLYGLNEKGKDWVEARADDDRCGERGRIANPALGQQMADYLGTCSHSFDTADTASDNQLWPFTFLHLFMFIEEKNGSCSKD